MSISDVYTGKYINRKDKSMKKNLKENKKETLKEAYERVFNYDPTDEEVEAKYDDEFNKWLEEETFE